MIRTAWFRLSLFVALCSVNNVLGLEEMMVPPDARDYNDDAVTSVRLKGDNRRPDIYTTFEEQVPHYCDPPNPCPIGYTEANGCVTNVENTVQFNSEYFKSRQRQGLCPCDKEHDACDQLNMPHVKEVSALNGLDEKTRVIVNEATILEMYEDELGITPTNDQLKAAEYEYEEMIEEEEKKSKAKKYKAKAQRFKFF